MEINSEATQYEDAVRFDEAEIAIVKAALKTKLFRQDEPKEVRSEKFQKLLTDLSVKFGAREVKFEFVPGLPDNVEGQYEVDTNTVRVYRFSLTTTLFLFWRAVIEQRGIAQAIEDRLPTPIAFALSAFKQAAPRMFEEAKTRGRLCGTAVPYTDGGRIQPAAIEPDVTDADDGDQPQRPDIDPENRGNGPHED